MKPKRATHDVKIKEKHGKRSGTVGAAWVNDDGSFSIQLNAGVTLSWQDDVYITVWPRGEGVEENPEVDLDDDEPGSRLYVERLIEIVSRPELLNKWEKSAFPNMLDQVTAGRDLTPAQRSAVAKACKRLGVK